MSLFRKASFFLFALTLGVSAPSLAAVVAPESVAHQAQATETPQQGQAIDHAQGEAAKKVDIILPHISDADEVDLPWFNKSGFRVWRLPQKQKCHQTNRRAGISSHRFGQNLLRRQPGQLLKNRRTQIFIRNDPELFRRRHREQPGHGLLDHGLLAVESQQLLGFFLAA